MIGTWNSYDWPDRIGNPSNHRPQSAAIMTLQKLSLTEADVAPTAWQNLATREGANCMLAEIVSIKRQRSERDSWPLQPVEYSLTTSLSLLGELNAARCSKQLSTV